VGLVDELYAQWPVQPRERYRKRRRSVGFAARWGLGPAPNKAARPIGVYGRAMRGGTAPHGPQKIARPQKPLVVSGLGVRTDSGASALAANRFGPVEGSPIIKIKTRIGCQKRAPCAQFQESLVSVDSK